MSAKEECTPVVVRHYQPSMPHMVHGLRLILRVAHGALPATEVVETLPPLRPLPVSTLPPLPKSLQDPEPADAAPLLLLAAPNPKAEEDRREDADADEP